MIRSWAALAWVSVTVLAGPVFAGIPAHATAGGCSYQLFGPQLINVRPAGPAQVSATLQPTTCTGVAQPTSSSVCVRTDTSQGTCATAYGWSQAQVFWDPPQGRVNYTVTASGCTKTWNPSGDSCEPMGPVRAVLGM